MVGKKEKFSLLLLFIFVNEMCDNFFFSTFSLKSNGDLFLEIIFYLCFLSLQVFIAPIQAGYSDFYCRKKSIIFSLLFSLAGSLLIFSSLIAESISISLIFSGLFIKGVLGNTVPICRAAICDLQMKDIRFFLGLSTCAIALGYFAIWACNIYFGYKLTFIPLSLLFLISLWLCLYFFSDLRVDRPGPHKMSFKKEIIEMKDRFFKDSNFMIAMGMYFFSEAAFYSIHMLDVDLHVKDFRGFSAIMIFGYWAGIFAIKLFNKEDKKLIKLGYLIGFIFIAQIPIYYFIGTLSTLGLMASFFYSFGVAFLTPSLFAALSKTRGLHDQGKMYGLLDSADTIGYALAFVVIAVLNFFKLDHFLTLIASLFIFLISWGLYAKFRFYPQGKQAKH